MVTEMADFDPAFVGGFREITPPFTQSLTLIHCQLFLGNSITPQGIAGVWSVRHNGVPYLLMVFLVKCRPNSCSVGLQYPADVVGHRGRVSHVIAYQCAAQTPFCSSLHSTLRGQVCL